MKELRVKKVRARLAGIISTAEGTELQPGTGSFEILAITAGEGNGWMFSEAALRDSLQRWQGAACFIDHGGRAAGRSVRDLAGQLLDPRWDTPAAGVRCTLHPLGPSGDLLRTLGRTLLDSDSPPAVEAATNVGFSADVAFTARGRQVEKILRVYSVDLVMNPARGGKFLSEIGPAGQSESSQRQFQEEHMAEQMEQGSVEHEHQAQLSDHPVANSGDDVQAVRAAMCAHLLESGLAAARLPAPATEQVRRQFAGRVFTPGELDSAIASARELVAALTGGAVVRGSAHSPRAGQISAMFSSSDQISAAVHDLLGAGRPAELSGARPHRLTGIRELYTLATGDAEFRGVMEPERAMFATTVDLPNLLKNTLNKCIVQEWETLGATGYRWWEPVVAVEHFNSLQPVTGVLVGEVTVLPTVNEGAAYQALPVADSAETGIWSKYGGYIGLTMEMFERDETHKLRQYPRKLASASLRRISSLVGSIFTANDGAGPVMTDGVSVFDPIHRNLSMEMLSPAEWERASAAIYDQPMLVASGGTPPRLALDARYLIVPRSLRLAARQILYPALEREVNIVSENMQRGVQGDVITCPEFTNPDQWAAAADPRMAPGIIVGERFGLMPEIFIADSPTGGAVFTNDEMRMKVRHWVSVFVADYRPLFKSNVSF